jgi:hypothetical protein
LGNAIVATAASGSPDFSTVSSMFSRLNAEFGG